MHSVRMMGKDDLEVIYRPSDSLDTVEVLRLSSRPPPGFLESSSPSYLLALRQGGHRDDLIRLAAERGVRGWFDPPLCTFAELPRFLGSSNRQPCDDFERRVILGGVLRRLGGEVFGRLKRPRIFSARWIGSSGIWYRKA